MSIYDLYGIDARTLEDAKALVERVLGCKLEERDSSYHGGTYYHWGDEASEHFMLKTNYDSIDGEPAELSFPNTPFLLYINESNRSDSLKVALEAGGSAVTLLRHEEL